MIRLLVTFTCYMVVGHWLYSEVQVAFPQAVPAIDYAIQKVQIPTHDRWDTKKIASTVDAVAAQLTHVGRGISQTFSATPAEAQEVKVRRVSTEPGFERF